MVSKHLAFALEVQDFAAVVYFLGFALFEFDVLSEQLNFVLLTIAEFQLDKRSFVFEIRQNDAVPFGKQFFDFF